MLMPERMWLDKKWEAFPDHAGFSDPSYSADLTLYVRASIVETMATEMERLRAGIEAFVDGSADTMDRAAVFRKDGVMSKHDQCSHGIRMYEGCGNCADVYFLHLLAPDKEG